MKKTMDVFKRRKLAYTGVFCAVLLIFTFSAVITQFDPIQGIASLPADRKSVV